MQSLKSALANTNILIIYALAALLPVFFTPLTSEFYDTGKFILLGIGVLLMFVLWGATLFTGKLTIIKTPLDILLVLYLLVAIISTVLSPSQSTSLFGLLPKVYGSLLSQVEIVLLYFMLVSNIKNAAQTNKIVHILTFSTLIMALASLLAYFGVFLPFAFAKFTSFSLAGSPTATAIILAILLPVVLTNFLADRKLGQLKPTSLISAAAIPVFLVTIILVGNLASWVGALFGAGLVLYSRKPTISQIGLLAAFAAICLIFAVLSYTPTLKDKTQVGKLAANFQREQQLDFSQSWKIAASSFRDSPILGTGPATFAYDYTQYKTIEANSTPFWNVRLNAAHDQYLQTWAEMGGAGALLMLAAALTFLISALKNHDSWGLGLSGVTFLIISALAPQTLAIGAVGFMLLALYMTTRRQETKEASIQFPPHPLSSVMIFLPVLAISLFGLFLIGKLAVGEYYHRLALNSIASNKALDAYNQLIVAEKINDKADLYRIDLSQTNFALANAIASQKGPNEASPGGSLTDQDRSNIQQLLQQAIAEGKNAIALSPRSAANFEVLALLYRQISGVAQNATQFSLDAYGRAIQLDPFNPLLRLAVGGVYYQAKNYDLAIRFFDDAVSLKPDYPNALYNLAVALRDKGNFAEGAVVAERLVASLQDKPNSEDYKTASQLLSDLKAKVPSPSEPPVATPSAALEKGNLPKVLNLPEPGQVSTPAAVKK
jgi:O-antigen ligase